MKEWCIATYFDLQKTTWQVIYPYVAYSQKRILMLVSAASPSS